MHVEHDARGDRRVFRVRFAWNPGPLAGWARDPAIRAHGVLLPPRGEAVATFAQDGAGWAVTALTFADPPLPRVVDASAWPRAAERRTTPS